MPWRQAVKLTLYADDIIAERKEQRDKADRERAAAARPGGGWGRL